MRNFFCRIASKLVVALCGRNEGRPEDWLNFYEREARSAQEHAPEPVPIGREDDLADWTHYRPPPEPEEEQVEDPEVEELYTRAAHQAAAHAERRNVRLITRRVETLEPVPVILPLGSLLLGPGQYGLLDATAQRLIRPKYLVVQLNGNASNFAITELSIGVYSVFAASGSIPVTCFLKDFAHRYPLPPIVIELGMSVRLGLRNFHDGDYSTYAVAMIYGESLDDR